MRKLAWTAGIVIAVIVLAGIGAALYLRSAGADYDAQMTTDVRQRVEVWRDSLGVPHIWANSEGDALFAQGYVHAQDRLFQMELFRRLIEGRLAEAIGPQVLGTDRFMRTVGLLRAAAASERVLDPETRRLIEAYVAGVNASIRERSGALPPEFVLLKIEPEAWTVRHVLGIGKMMAWDLAEYNYGLELTRAVRRAGAEKARALYPVDFAWGAVIMGPARTDTTSSSVASAEAAQRGDDTSTRTSQLTDATLARIDVPDVPELARGLVGWASMVQGSNSWVISGEHTASGKPILANDMHLGLRAPSLWHLMALHGGGLDVAGMSLPGAPGIVAGHSRAIAWGYTNAYVDDVDLFIERVDPADSTRYLVPGGSRPFVVLTEVIPVKGQAADTIRVRFTRHGPILNGRERRVAGAELLAMRWASHEPSTAAAALLRMGRARSAAEFIDAARLFNDPHQNIVYADSAGASGYVMAGRVAQRANGARPPLLPVPGWTDDHEWNGFLPFEQHPQVSAAAEGFVVTANNRQQWGAAGDRISSRWEEPFRAMRIREMIEERIRAGKKITGADAHRMQLDVKDVRAARYVDRAAAAADRAGLQDVAASLRAWDLQAALNSRGAAYYYVWYDQLRKGLARSLYGSGGWFPEDAVDRVLETRAVSWATSPGTFDSLAAQAMREAAPIAGGKAWGELNSVVIEHPLGSVAVLERGFNFNVGPAPHGGSGTTVNVSHHGLNFPTRTRGGASQRHVVDMANVDRDGGFILPTGQSGVPFDAHYRDQFELWRGGGLWRVPLDRRNIEPSIAHRMVLVPRAER